MDIADINPVNPALFQQDKHWDIFSRLRKDDPVHFNEDSDFGRYWSITKFNHIMQVDTNHKVFSSEGGITLGPTASQIASGETMDTPMFIAMDPPKHDQQRATVSPVVQPANLAKLENTIRTRAGKILDELPRNEEFDWVDKVSIELTTQMLATLFDFPLRTEENLPDGQMWQQQYQAKELLIHCSKEEKNYLIVLIASLSFGMSRQSSLKVTI